MAEAACELRSPEFQSRTTLSSIAHSHFPPSNHRICFGPLCDLCPPAPPKPQTTPLSPPFSSSSTQACSLPLQTPLWAISSPGHPHLHYFCSSSWAIGRCTESCRSFPTRTTVNLTHGLTGGRRKWETGRYISSSLSLLSSTPW